MSTSREINITIDPEFKALIPPLAPDELRQLEENILRDGCRDPLVVWDNILIDGHNRYEICTRHGLPFETKAMVFEDRDAAMDWMDANQLGRRNLTPDAFTLLLGRRYNRAKKKANDGGKGTPKAAAKTDDSQPETQPELKIAPETETTVGQNAPRLERTSAHLAAQHGVDEKTVRRAGQFAAAVDKLGLGAEVATGQVEASRKDIIKAATALPENPTPDQVEEAKKHVHVSKNSGNNEWYTPAEYISAATALMDRIDLDPASSPKANETVRAAKFYTAEEDGRDKDWSGNIWMNPPYAQPLIGDFSAKLAEACESGAVKNACVLVNNATETAWFQRLLDVASAVCFPRSRIRFLDPDGNPGAPLQGQAVIYMGSQTERFCILFSKFGQCLMK